MDKINREARSRNMSLIRAKNTKPELLLRKALFKLGFRYKVHLPLPGKPDIVFTAKRIAVFIHGCFWHGHGCQIDHIPKTNIDYWKPKIASNKTRDKESIHKLKILRWKAIIIWECTVRQNLDQTVNIVRKHLDQ